MILLYLKYYYQNLVFRHQDNVIIGSMRLEISWNITHENFSYRIIFATANWIITIPINSVQCCQHRSIDCNCHPLLHLIIHYYHSFFCCIIFIICWHLIHSISYPMIQFKHNNINITREARPLRVRKRKKYVK